jgi:predicted metal-binding membrane protein
MEMRHPEPRPRLSAQTDCGTSGDMTDIARTQREFLSSPVAKLAAVAARPRSLAIGCIIAVSALGWVYLAVAHASGTALLDAICGASGANATTRDVTLVGAMWLAMTFAMMLPNAAPMVLTYSEIADTAVRKGVNVISPFVLVAGYIIVWLGFATVAALAQASFAATSLLSPTPVWLSAAAFGAAGLYQFSTLKHACLQQCRAPFPFFFSNWQTTTHGVFRLGVQQGLFCLGCCWAAMALMLVVGTMNVFWMAALGALLTAERLVTGAWLTRAAGVGLIGFGAYLAIGAGAGFG